MNDRNALSHVASPGGRDTRQIHLGHATEGATVSATDCPSRPSLRDLARDTLARHERDKGAEWHATRLRDAINRCCDIRGDDAVNRAALIEECGQLPFEGQADMRAHFEMETGRWSLDPVTASPGPARPLSPSVV